MGNEKLLNLSNEQSSLKLKIENIDEKKEF